MLLEEPSLFKGTLQMSKRFTRYIFCKVLLKGGEIW